MHTKIIRAFKYFNVLIFKDRYVYDRSNTKMNITLALLTYDRPQVIFMAQSFTQTHGTSTF